MLSSAPGPARSLHADAIIALPEMPGREQGTVLRTVVVHGTGTAVSVEPVLLLGNPFQDLRSLILDDLPISPLPARHVLARGATAPQFCFPNLTVLSICVDFIAHQEPPNATSAAFQLFSHMPNLSHLKLVASPTGDDIGASSDRYELSDAMSRLTDPPFKLQSFSCAGGMSLLGVARIIWCSRNSLRDLSVTCIWDRSSNALAESVFRSSLRIAAPRIRRLHVEDSCTFLETMGVSAARAFSQLAFLSLDSCSECVGAAQAFVSLLPCSLLRLHLPAGYRSFEERRLRVISNSTCPN
ncbi:hypothetical protein AURDEDRAFT_176179 [Auricularia subglabra TFB-10046 SS5]|uniref:F-box domain-containing protein n=1 Tax=Auricularia subglabra (strain TFB-10046 / SS5) TaxID=717982 RepID=J0LDM8_AURST|nr:hypothetical protein AURDEDRAFT_176179 [Auricularia subglabra TFB-10046 SS5]